MGQTLSLTPTSAQPLNGSQSLPLPQLTITGTWDCRQKGAIQSNASYPVLSPAIALIATQGGGGWAEVNPGSCNSFSGPSAYPCLLQLDVSTVSSPFSVSAAPVISAVFVGGYRYVQARSPNLVDLSHREGVNRSEFLFVNGTASSNHTIVVPSLISFPPDYFVNCTIRIRTTEWTYESRTIGQSYPSAEGGVLVLTSPVNYPPTTVYEGNSAGLYLEAGIHSSSTTGRAFLDSPGEWWADSRGVLYLLPRDESEAAGLMAGTLIADVLMDDSPSGVTFSGLSQYSVSLVHLNVTELGKAGGVSVGASVNATRVDVTDVHITQALGNGFNVATSTRANTPSISLTHSSITDVDSNCFVVSVMGEDHPAETVVTAEYNTFSRCGMSAGLGVSGDGGAQGVEVEHTVLQHNVIDAIGYIGVRPAYFSVIADNVVTNVMQSLNDGAALYVWGAPGVGVELRGNVLVNATGNVVSSPASYGVLANSLYLDDGDWNTTMEGNVGIGATGYCIFLHNTRTSTIRNNTCYDGGWGMQADRDDLPFRDNVLIGNVVVRNGSRSHNTSRVVPLMQLTTKYNNVSGWYVNQGGRYCDGGVNNTHTFELALEWSPKYYDTLEEWNAATSHDSDDSVMGCDEDEGGEGGADTSDGISMRHEGRWWWVVVIASAVCWWSC